MNDGLGYIREAIAKYGSSAKVDVIRWEKDPQTGYYSKEFKVEIKADIALAELQKPISKRSRVWKFIRPIGMTMEGNLTTQSAENRLNNPNLIEELTAKIKAELIAEMEAEQSKTGKRKKKNSETVEQEDQEENNNDLTSL